MNILRNLAYLTFLLPLIVFFFQPNRKKNQLSWVVFFYIAYCLMNEILMAVMSFYSIDERFPNSQPAVYAIFTIIEYCFFSFYLYQLLRNNIFKKFLIYSSCFFLLIAFYNLYTIISNTQANNLIDTIPVSTSALILIIFSILYLFEEIQSPKIGFIYENPAFWVTVGIMIYFSGTFFLFLQYSDLSISDKRNFWTINLICVILKNIFITVSFLLKPNKKSTSFDLGDEFSYTQKPY